MSDTMKIILVCLFVLSLCQSVRLHMLEFTTSALESCMKQHNAIDDFDEVGKNVTDALLDQKINCTDLSENSKKALKCFLKRMDFIDSKDGLKVEKIKTTFPVLAGKAADTCFELQNISKDICIKVMKVSTCFLHAIKLKLYSVLTRLEGMIYH